MGLMLCVGVLSASEDAEMREMWEQSFADLNAYLASKGLPPHEEPTLEKAWECDIPGYSGLHTLRRVAAHLQFNKRLPQESASEDPLLDRYYNEQADTKKGQSFLGFRKKPSHDRKFDHLIFHSDCEGLYLPRDFDPVLQSEEILGLELGSVNRLQKELAILRKELGIPEDVTDPFSQQDKHLGTERYVCVALSEACRVSLETGAALVFL